MWCSSILNAARFVSLVVGCDPSLVPERSIAASELCYGQVDAGHGGGKPTAKIIEEAADICAFIARSLDVTLVSSDDNSTHQQDDNSTKEQDDKSCLRSCC